MRPSLFDAVDLERLRAAVNRSGTAAGALLACLHEGCALQHDVSDPGWADRDRLVVGVPALRARITSALAEGWYEIAPSDALAVAYGAAAASAIDGGIYRVWCLLDAAACDDGGTWEAALAAAEAAVTPLVALVDGSAARPSPERLVELWRAAGWAVVTPAREAVALLGALDHAVATAGPAAVVVR